MKIIRKSLHEITKFFDGEGGASGGGAGGGGSTVVDAGAGGGLPPVFNIREHIGDDGSFKADWHKAAGVSENLGKKFTRPEALARAYESLETQIGKKGVIVPGPNATAQEKDAYYAALGRPAKPEEYGFAKPATVKIGDKDIAVPERAWDAARATAWQQKLHAMGVPKDQANQIMQAAVEESVVAFTGLEGAKTQIREQAQAALKTAFGVDYDTNMAAAARAAKEFGGDDLVNHPALGNDPVLIKALAKIGASIGERPGAGLRESGGRAQPSKTEAIEQIAVLGKQIVERSKADRNWNHTAEATRLKAEKTALFKIAYPEPR